MQTRVSVFAGVTYDSRSGEEGRAGDGTCTVGFLQFGDSMLYCPFMVETVGGSDQEHDMR